MANAAKTRQQAVQLATVEAWLARHRSENTRRAYRCDIDAFGQWCVQRGALPLHIDLATLMAFETARRAAGDSTATLRRRRSSLSSFYDFSIETNATDVNPLAGATRVAAVEPARDAPELLSRSAVDAYLALAEALDPRLDALVSLLVYDGVKLGEALELNIDDLSGQPPKVSLRLRRRGEQQRIELHQATARAVRRCAGRRRGQPLFVNARSANEPKPGHRLTRFGADHLIRQLSPTGNDRVTSNALRRYHLASKPNPRGQPTPDEHQ